MRDERKKDQSTARRAAAALEQLESRTLMYSPSGSAWPSPDISYSFMPDGAALDGGHTSALFAHLDGQHPTDAWQREFARALQTWAQYIPVNFHLVADDGSPQGTTGSVQGDPRFGDIRLSARTTEAIGFAWFPSTTTRGGDVTLSTAYPFELGDAYDLYSVLLHEAGHALGLAHSTDPNAVMVGDPSRVWTDLGSDDIAGIQAIYGTRIQDAFDASAPNDYLAAATRLSPDAAGLIAATADLTGSADVDHYSITVPSGSDGTLIVSVDARGLSLLAPAVRVYDDAGNLVASASAGSAYGTVATVSLSGLVAGQKYVIVADGASGDVFAAGAYRLKAEFGLAASPPPPPTPTSTPTPAPAVEPDRFEFNDVVTSATDFGRIAGFTQTGLSVHNSADKDYYRFVPSKSGTYMLSAAAGQGLGLRLTLLDGAQRVLATAQAVSNTLTAGQVYYINVEDSAGASGGYNLTLAKSGTGGGGGKKGYLQAPHLAGDALQLDNDDARYGHSEHGLSRAWVVLNAPDPSAASGAFRTEELERLAAEDAAISSG